jgi:hypothetical protein
MRTVTTRNSVYEINEVDHMIRRMNGVNDPTPRQGADGEWQKYSTIAPLLDGLMIVWGINADGSAASTWTSAVVTDTALAVNPIREDPSVNFA